MKRIFLLLIAMLVVATTFAQAPQGFTYQAAVRNNDGTAVANQQVNVRISLVQGSALGVERYAELHTPTTDAAGLFTIVVGQGTGLANCMMADCIDWANGPWFLKTQIDPDGGQNFSLSTTQQLMSVPYALFAANVTHDTVHIRDSVVVHIIDSVIVHHRDSIIYACDDYSMDVVLVFDGNVIAGTRAKKMMSRAYNAFYSVNFPVLAKIMDGRIIRYIPYEPVTTPVHFQRKVSDSICVMKLIPK